MLTNYCLGFAMVCGLLLSANHSYSQEPPTASPTMASVVRDYVLRCRKPNGAFGPLDQEYTDAAWNFPAVATLQLLGVPVENPAAVAQHGLGFPAGHVGYGHWQFFHEHRLRSMLACPITPTNRHVTLRHQGFKPLYYGSPWGTDGDTFFKAASSGERPDPRDTAADSMAFYNLSSLYYVLAGLAASGRTAANPELLVAYIAQRQSPSGGFVDVRTADAPPLDDDAHIAHTFHAIAALRFLDAEPPHANRCADWISRCADPSGGFLFQPNRQTLGNRPDIYYAWAALAALEKLKKLDSSLAPAQVAATQRWIESLQNSDGGFGDQPGWRSRLYSTYYAMDSLRILRARLDVAAKLKQPSQRPAIADGRFKIYQAVFKMPNCQSDDLADLQRRGLNLLAVKSEKFTDIEPLLAAIRQRQLPMDVVLCPEMYPHRLQRPGTVTLDHVGNFVLDPRWNDSQKSLWQTADQIGRSNPTAAEYGRRVLEPLRTLKSFCYPEQDFEMEFAYAAYDAGLAGNQGYNAILASFNWSPRDFVRVFPWRERYIDKLVPIADVDAHGDLKKWSPQLDHCRNLFIAEGPTYADFQSAAQAGRVVCVIAQPAGVPTGVTYYGRPEAVEYVQRHFASWRWWNQAENATVEKR